MNKDGFSKTAMYTEITNRDRTVSMAHKYLIKLILDKYKINAKLINKYDFKY